MLRFEGTKFIINDIEGHFNINTYLRPLLLRIRTFKFGKCFRKTKSICAILLWLSLRSEAVLSSIGIGGWVRLRPMQLTNGDPRLLPLSSGFCPSGQIQSWGHVEAVFLKVSWLISTASMDLRWLTESIVIQSMNIIFKKYGLVDVF